jgi:hypothetical protein
LPTVISLFTESPCLFGQFLDVQHVHVVETDHGDFDGAILDHDGVFEGFGSVSPGHSIMFFVQSMAVVPPITPSLRL